MFLIDPIRAGRHLACGLWLAAAAFSAAGAAHAEQASLDEILGEVADPLAQIERQIEAQEYDYASNWLESHIESLEAASHRYDPRLVRPLTLLGDAYAGQEEYAEALKQYRRALHLNRVNRGLNDPEQVELVYREANAFKALGDYEQANDREEYAYHVLRRAHGDGDEALLPGIYHLAHWYERTANVFAARALYEQAVDIIEHNGKQDTPAAIPAYQGIATSYRMERFPPFYMSGQASPETSIIVGTAMEPSITINNFPEGEEALQQIIKIRRTEQPPDPVALAEAVLELADWYTLFDKENRAEPLYAHAWEILAEADGVDVVSYFAEPELLYFPAPPNPSAPPAEERGPRSTGYVEVAFEVTEDGYVRGLDTIASEPEELMDFRVRKSLRLARYRPMLVDGVPVAKGSHTYRHEFPYYPERKVAEGDSPQDQPVSG